MKIIKIFNEEGVIPSFAKLKDSGLDVTANELEVVLEGLSTNGAVRESYSMVTRSYCNSEDVNWDPDKIRKHFIENFLKMLEDVWESKIYIVKLFFKYMTGTRVILPENSDMKGKPKSSKAKVAPYLDSLQNCDGLIDEQYRGIIQFQYEFSAMATMYLFEILKSINDMYSPMLNTYVKTIADKVYLPSKTVSIGQLVPEYREDFQVKPIEEWLPEYEQTDRGIGGHGSTNR